MSEALPRVRSATAADAAACAGIYAHYVTNTAVSFETEPPTPAEMSRRIETAQVAHDWLVIEDASGAVGYAYGGTFRPRASYGWTAEVSVYLAATATGRGLGSMVYLALIDRLAELGYRTLVAGYTLPNTASERLHRALGFEPVGVFRRVGVKFGRWQDVAWVQRSVGDAAAPEGPPPGPWR